MSSFDRTVNEIRVFFLDMHGRVDKLKILLVVSVSFSVVSLGIFGATFIQTRIAKVNEPKQMPKKVLTIDERAQALASLSSDSNTTSSGSSSTSTPKKRGLTEEEKLEILKNLSK